MRTPTLAVLAFVTLGGGSWGADGPASPPSVPAEVFRAMAKVYGAGRFAGLEGHQSGFFIAADPPQILTTDSTVLEGGRVTVIDADGERCEARVVGRDAATGLALLECRAESEPPALLPLEGAAEAKVATPVWVFSNAFAIAAGDEPVTVQRGRVAAVARLDLGDAAARRPVGVPEAGSEVVVLSAITSNPGAAGGAVVDDGGALLGVLGAECRSSVAGSWLNYAVPATSAAASLVRMRAGGSGVERDARPSERPRAVARRLGIVLLPAVTARTPAYVESVRVGSAAAGAGLSPDDLIVAVDGVTVGAVDSALVAIQRGVGRAAVVELTVLRGDELVRLVLREATP